MRWRSTGRASATTSSMLGASRSPSRARAREASISACAARALLGERLAPSIDDVVALARPVLRHRMALNFSARADGVVLSDVIDRLVERFA